MSCCSPIVYHEVPVLKKPLEKFHFAVSAGGVLYISCIQGFKPGTLELASAEPAAQARQVLDNLRRVLEASGSRIENVVKFTLILRDMNDFPAVNDEIEKVWPHNMPARTSIQAVIPKGCLLAIDAMAIQCPGRL
jgi:2-iminobutanoate/2-iminopropanoate deaminase